MCKTTLQFQNTISEFCFDGKNKIKMLIWENRKSYARISCVKWSGILNQRRKLDGLSVTMKDSQYAYASIESNLISDGFGYDAITNIVNVCVEHPEGCLYIIDFILLCFVCLCK